VSWSFDTYDGFPATGNDCQVGTQPGIVTDDCIVALDIAHPTVVDGLRHPGPVGEPGSVLLMGAGAALGLGARRRRRYAA
jgi:hypothetical protein